MDQNQTIIQRDSLEGLTHGWEGFIIDKRSSVVLVRKKGEKSAGLTLTIH